MIIVQYKNESKFGFEAWDQLEMTCPDVVTKCYKKDFVQNPEEEQKGTTTTRSKEPSVVALTLHSCLLPRHKKNKLVLEVH